MGYCRLSWASGTPAPRRGCGPPPRRARCQLCAARTRRARNVLRCSNRNGLHYGVKVRAPHSLVMAAVFKNHLPIKDNIVGILKVSLPVRPRQRPVIVHGRQYRAIYPCARLLLHAIRRLTDRRRQMSFAHARNLGTFVLIYKGVLSLVPARIRPAAPSPPHQPIQRPTPPRAPTHAPEPRPRPPRQLRVLHEAAGVSVHSPPGRPAERWHALLAGWIGGQIVWAKHSSVNEQATRARPGALRRPRCSESPPGCSCAASPSRACMGRF